MLASLLEARVSRLAQVLAGFALGLIGLVTIGTGLAFVLSRDLRPATAPLGLVAVFALVVATPGVLVLFPAWRLLRGLRRGDGGLFTTTFLHVVGIVFTVAGIAVLTTGEFLPGATGLFLGIGCVALGTRRRPERPSADTSAP